MGKKEKPAVAAAELAVLGELWDRPPLPIREIADRLYPGGGTSEYATVQKLLERLEAKGYVRRNRSSFAHTFSATVARGDLIRRELEEVAEKLCEGSFTPILLHLVEKRALSARDRAMLRRLLDEEERGGGK
jgi:BlaI family transcriptional regulator, penicillinase repressor